MKLDIDGLGDMKLICGITAVEKRDKQGKEGKVSMRRISFDFCYFLEVFFTFFILVG